MQSAVNQCLCIKRQQKDLQKLQMSNFTVIPTDKSNEFQVVMQGPDQSFYQNGIWTLNVVLPSEYPYKSPSIGFCNKIYHPNIDISSGTICLDVLNQAWSPMFDLINIFDAFIPQLLQYPNPQDPLNPEAAALYMNDIKNYEQRVQLFIENHALNQSQEEMLDENFEDNLSSKSVLSNTSGISLTKYHF